MIRWRSLRAIRPGRSGAADRPPAARAAQVHHALDEGGSLGQRREFVGHPHDLLHRVDRHAVFLVARRKTTNCSPRQPISWPSSAACHPACFVRRRRRQARRTSVVAEHPTGRQQCDQALAAIQPADRVDLAIGGRPGSARLAQGRSAPGSTRSISLTCPPRCRPNRAARPARPPRPCRARRSSASRVQPQHRAQRRPAAASDPAASPRPALRLRRAAPR